MQTRQNQIIDDLIADGKMRRNGRGRTAGQYAQHATTFLGVQVGGAFDGAGLCGNAAAHDGVISVERKRVEAQTVLRDLRQMGGAARQR